MHSTVRVDTSLVVRCIIVPCNTEHFTKVVVQIGESRVGIHLKLKFDMTITVNEDKSWFDVKSTEINGLSDLDQVGERDATLKKKNVTVIYLSIGACKPIMKHALTISGFVVPV